MSRKNSPAAQDGNIGADEQKHQAKEQRARRNNAWRGKLSKLCKVRFGNHFMPNKAKGRAMLVALLRFKLKPDDAMEIAPWLGPAKLKKLRTKARLIPFNDIGKLICCTYAEREDCKLWFLRPCDVPWEEVLKLQAEKNRKKARERQRRKRQQRQERRDAMQNVDRRDDVIMHILTMDWTPVSALVRKARKWRVFCRPDGTPLRNLRDAVHFTLRQLEKHDAIKIDLRAGPRGPVCFVRRTHLEELEGHGERDAFSDRRSVGPKIGAEKAPRLTVIHGLRA